ncbi:MAG: hypothetical protein ABH834_06590 [Candidatus Altiarchaeota archaeon]
METIADVTLRWFDESALMEKDPRQLTETFLASLGVTSDVAVDVMEVLFKARAEDRALRTQEILNEILKTRKERRIKAKKGLGLRNIQVWVKYFKSIKLVDRVGERVRFTGNKTPTQAFSEYTKPVIEESVSFIEALLAKTEEAYGIK